MPGCLSGEAASGIGEDPVRCRVCCWGSQALGQLSSARGSQEEALSPHPGYLGWVWAIFRPSILPECVEQAAGCLRCEGEELEHSICLKGKVRSRLVRRGHCLVPDISRELSLCCLPFISTVHGTGGQCYPVVGELGRGTLKASRDCAGLCRQGFLTRKRRLPVAPWGSGGDLPQHSTDRVSSRGRRCPRVRGQPVCRGCPPVCPG